MSFLKFTNALWIAASCTLAATGIAAETAKSDPKTKSVMHEIYPAISRLLPLSLSDKEFYNPANRKMIEKDLETLAKAAKKLQDHAEKKDPSFKFVSRSFGSDTQELAKWFKAGRFDEARYLLHNISENCISCHAKGQSTGDFPGMDKMFSNLDVSSLPLIERARLQMATRQFNGALASFEELFKSNQYSPADLVFVDAFGDYLKLSVRVQRNFARPLKTLREYRTNQKPPQFVDAQLRDWIQSLERFESQKDTPVTMASVRKVFDGAVAKLKFPRDRDAMIDFIVASGWLDELLRENKLSGDEKAEAYFILGMVEESFGRAFWVSQAQYLFESSIRAAPKSKVAKDAYAMLEESVYMDYSGSSGTDIPEDVQVNLEQLRKMVE